MSDLTQDRLRYLICYVPETGRFIWRVATKCKKAYTRIGRNHRSRYLKIVVDGKWYPAHRLAWLWVYGEFPNSEIDHINTDKTDNRLINLRLATPLQNRCNRGPTVRCKTGYKGVFWDVERNKWKAEIRFNGQIHWLGRFDSAEKAHEAYSAAAIKIHGEFANAGVVKRSAV